MSSNLSGWQMLGLGSAFAGLGLGSNLLTSAISTRKAWKYAQEAMALQYEYQKRGLVEGPGLSRKGLEQAGYNPLLALGSSGSIGNISSPNVPDMTANMPDITSSAVGALNGYKEGKLLDTQIKSAKTDLDIKKEQLEKLRSQNITSVKNLLTNPEAREKFIEGLPSPLKKTANSAISFANSEDKLGKLNEVVNESIPNPKVRNFVISSLKHSFAGSNPAKYSLYTLGKYAYKYYKNKYSARSGTVYAGKNKYEVEYLPDSLGNSDLIRR